VGVRASEVNNYIHDRKKGRDTKFEGEQRTETIKRIRNEGRTIREKRGRHGKLMQGKKKQCRGRGVARTDKA